MEITQYEGRTIIEWVIYWAKCPPPLVPILGWSGRLHLSKECGRLVLSEYWLQFFGQKVQRHILLRDITDVTVVQIAHEISNEWVWVRYGLGLEAWFKERDMLGWSTLGGSSPRIAQLIKKAMAGSLPGAHPDDQH
jgi:hypothetical protein